MDSGAAGGPMSLALDLGDRGADISPCGRYRYSLWRRWDATKPAVLFVMLNPSTADADVDDPTIRKCIGFARRWGMGGIHVCNLYPWRATDPRELPRGPEVFGEDGHERNADAVRRAAAEAGRIVAAWGANHGPFPWMPDYVAGLLAAYPVEALRLTADGSPGHPLLLPYSVEPVVYREAC